MWIFDMFGALKLGSNWRLTIYKGAREDELVYVEHATLKDKPKVDIKFRRGLSAKACAIDLNKKYWKVYKANGENREKLGMIAHEMLDLIEQHMAKEDGA